LKIYIMSSKNNKQNLSSPWLLSSIKIGLFASLFMPLIVNGSFIFPYIFPKQAFFQIVVEIVFALYLFLAFKDPTYRPRSSWLFRALSAYFVIMILSSVFGVNTYHSLWSNYERMAGVISLVHYLAFLFIAVNIFKSRQDWYLFFDVAIFASVVEAFYGLGQFVGIFVSSGGVRIDGTIGNASFLAGYMLLNALLAFWLAIEKNSAGWRWFYGGVIVLNLFIMYQTETRGAIVGFLAGLLALLLFYIFARSKDLAQLPFQWARNLRKYAIGILVFGFVAAGLIWLARDSAFVASSNTLSRVTHISLTEVTAQTRLLAWKMSLEGFKERPIFGWGPENYYVLFNKYYDPRLYPVESWFDRSHNAFLDVLVNTGLAGFAAYSAIGFLALWYLWSAWRKEKIKYHTAVIFTVILIAYAIQNIFVFDTQVTLLMFYSILSFAVFLSFAERPVEPAGAVKPNTFFIFSVVLLTVFLMYFSNIKPGAVSLTGINALQYLQANKADESLADFRNAFDTGTFGLPEVAMRTQDIAMSLMANTNSPADIKNKFVELAIEGMNRSLEMEPLNTRFMIILASVYLQAAAPNNSYLAQADNLLKKALELSPTRQELYFYIGQVRMYQGRTEEALASFKRAVDLNDKVGISHWNYGIIAIGVGQKDLGENEIKIAVSIDHPFKLADIKQLINAYTRTNDWPKIISLYQEWIKQTPNDAAAYAGLASVYAQTGEKQKAKDMALQAAVADSSYKDQAEQFVKELGK